MLEAEKKQVPMALIAALTFAFAALRQPIVLVLLLGYALLVEKDAYLIRQALIATLLYVAYSLAILAMDWLFGQITGLFELLELSKARRVFNTMHTIIGDLLYLSMLVFAVIGIVKTARGREANLLFFAKWAGGQTQPVAAQPAYAPPVQAPISPIQQPMQPPPAQAKPGFCAACGSPMNKGARFCKACGAKTGE